MRHENALKIDGGADLNVTLLTRSLSTAENSGLHRYAESIKNAVNGSDIKIDSAEMILDLKKGVLTALIEGFVRPFFEILRKKKDTDVFHATDDFCCLYFPLLGKKRKIVTFHHVTSERDKETRFLFLWKIIAKIGVMWADEIIAISPQTKGEVISTYGVNSEKISIAMNSVSDSFATQDVPKKRYIGCVSTLIKRKNVSSLLNIFEEFIKLPGTEGYILRVCGQGPEEDDLKEQAAKLGISGRVEFVPKLGEKELVRFYNESMVIANPSLHEGFGYVTLEAQRCSTPVVIFENADIPEEVVRFAVKAKDEMDFAEKIYGLITHEDLYQRIVANGLKYVSEFNKDFDKNIREIYLMPYDTRRTSRFRCGWSRE